MVTDDRNSQKEFTVTHGIGVFFLLLVVVIILGGISMSIFGLHITIILSEFVIFLVPFSFLHAGGYSFREAFTYPKRYTGIMDTKPMGHSPGFDLIFWIMVTVATVFLLVITSDIAGYIHQLMPRPKIQQEALLKLLVAKTWPEYLFRILTAGALAGFSEEFAFRGFLQSVFSKRLGKRGGFVLTAFLFALMHLDPWNFIGVFLLGLFLGYLVCLTGNLWYAIFVHSLSNIISFSVNFFSPDAGTDFGFTFPPHITLLCIFLFIISLAFIRRVYRKEKLENSSTG
jgi:membrane protease YdiL (CAAX protease family)